MLTRSASAYLLLPVLAFSVPSASADTQTAAVDSTVSLSATPAQLSQPVVLRATVSPGTATGTVDFASNSSPIPGCTGIQLLNGAATCNTSFSQLATLTITAAYNGDANTKPGSTSIQVTVNKVVAGSLLASDPVSPTYPNAVAIGIQLLGAIGVVLPTGTVTFSLGTVILPPVPVGSDGHASIVFPSGSLTTLSAGAWQISGTYSGDANYQNSTSLTLNLTVAKAATSLALTSSGQSGSVTIKATVTGPGVGATTGGTVTINNGGTPICSAIPLQNGVAACTAQLAASAALSANYTGDNNNLPSTGTLGPSAITAAFSISTTFTPSAPTYGAPLTITAALAAASGQPTPTGTVTFSDGPSPLGTAPVGSDARASITLSNLAVGTRSIVAGYSGDSNYQPAAASAVTIVVAKAATTLSLTSNAPQPGQAAVLKAAVSAPAGVPAIGTIGMSIGSTPVCTATVLQNGIATCTTQALQGGVYSITATYSGDPNTAASTATLTLTVGKPSLTIGETFTPLSPAYAAVVTITASLTAPSGQPAPTGTVAFTDGSTGLGVATVGTDGTASVGVSTFTVGTHNVTATYSGDFNYQAVVSSPVSITIGKAATTLSLVSNNVLAGQPATLRATVTVTGGGTAGGTVSMTNGAPALCTPVPVNNGSVTGTTPALAIGTYTINATYSGDANTLPSTASLPLTIGRASATISTTFNPTSPSYGTPLTITATLTGPTGQPVPTGTVTFSDGPAAIGTATVGADARASATVSTFGAGVHSITASYSGDSVYQSSTSTPVSVAVSKASSSLILTASSTQPIAVKATVTVAGGGTAGGTVSMSDNAGPVCSGVALQNGVASCTVTQPQSSDLISATYSGDSNTSPTSASLAINVQRLDAPFIYTAATLPNAPYGAPVTVNVLVLGGNGKVTPTGTVAFSDGTTALSTLALGSDGKASLPLTSLTIGTHNIGAVYSGDSNYQTATAANLPVIVSQANTTLSLTAGLAQIDQPVSVKAAVAVVSPGSATLGGTVDFSASGKPIAGCTGMTVQNGTASCNTSFSQLGTVTINAAYNGDANTASSSSSIQLSVGKASAGFYTAFTPASPAPGIAVTINALLQGASGLPPTGTVAFTDGTAALATVPVTGDGHASLVLPSGSLPALALGTHSIGAVYSGDANYLTATAPSLSIVVGKNTATITVSATTAQVAQPTVIKGTVTSGASASPTGTVDFTNNGTPIAGCTGVPLQNGAAACNTSFAQTGSYNIGANYSGDASTSAATATLSLTVGKAGAGIYTAFTPASPVYGATLTINALLLGATGLANPTGAVAFSDSGTLIASIPVGADGRASLVLPSASLAPLAAGAHSITALYNGDTNYGTNSADALSITVAKASTATQLTAANGTLTAAVTVVAPGAGTPTGTVQFYQGTTLIGSAALSSQSSGVTAALNAGLQSGSVSAVYQGDANFSGSTSTTVGVASKVQVTITADHNPASGGQPITFTIQVTAGTGTGTPTGTVQLSSDGAAIGNGTLSGGQTTVIANLSTGTHTITASYSGDSSFGAATATLQEVVNKPTAALTLTSSNATPVYGQPVTFTAQLGSQSLAGAVQFLDGTTAIGSAQASSGVATFTAANLSAGVHPIQAAWAGDASNAAATSQVLSQTVNQAQTTTTISASGQSLTANVAVTLPGTGSPTGTVKFVDAATNALIAITALDKGAAGIPMPSTNDSLVAQYSGDTNFQASTSNPLSRLTVVNAASYAVASFAPDEIGTLFGSNLASSTVSATSSLTTSLGGTTVTINDATGGQHPALLLFVSSGQVSFLMPSDIAAGAATVALTNSSRVTTTTPITVAKVAPGLFTLDASGQGLAAAETVRVHADNSQDPPQDIASWDAVRKVWVATPIDLSVPGDTVYLLLYGTGIRHYSAAISCAIGGFPVDLKYAGAQGTFAGLDQVNVVLPKSLRGMGSQQLILKVDGNASNAVTLDFQ